LIPAALMEALRQRYYEPQRHYHTWAHVEALLGHYRRWVRSLNRPEPVLWALYWHDAIYDPQRKDNEEPERAVARAGGGRASLSA
jgi:predicted metal-dependent HD superfamily phosphohydrolase